MKEHYQLNGHSGTAAGLEHVSASGIDRTGFTLIEILIVLIILTALMALAIPRVRLVSRENGLRTASTTVGSMFATARDEAKVNGTAGVLLRRNSNFVEGNLWFAADQIGILRAMPDYVGDQVFVKGATPKRGAMRLSDSSVGIPLPIEHESHPPVESGDWISLNHAAAKFEILATEVEDRMLRLTLDVGEKYPCLPPKFDDVSFVIHRKPQLRRSSLTSLGERQFIDLRLSGFDPVFERVIEDLDPYFENYDIEVLFEKKGYISSLLYWEVDANNNRTGRRVTRYTTTPIHFLITDAPESADTFPLADLAFWVTIKFEPAAPTISYSKMLGEARMTQLTPKMIGRFATQARGTNDEAL